MSAAFTPGPWNWCAEDESMAILGRGQFGEDSVLCLTICKNCQGRVKEKGRWEWDRCYAPSEANAHLIAAAPEIYEALERLVAARIDDADELITAQVAGNLALDKARWEQP